MKRMTSVACGLFVIASLSVGGNWPLRAFQDEVKIAGRSVASVPEWQLRLDKPVFTIGRGNDSLLIGPSTSAKHLRDGRILVLNSDKTWPVRVFSAQGRLVHQFHSGRGPEEFEGAVQAIGDVGDSLIIVNGDWSHRILDSALRIVRSVSSKGLTAISRKWGVDWRAMIQEKTADGRWLGIALSYPMLAVRAGQLDKPLQTEMRWIVMDKEFDSVRSLTSIPGVEMRGLRNGSGFGIDPDVFSDAPMLMVHAGLLYLTTNHMPEVEIRDTTGRIRSRIRLPLRRETVTEEDRQRYYTEMAENLRATGSSAEEIRRVTEAKRYFAKEFRFFDNLMVTDDGYIWLQLAHHGYAGAVPRHYLILSPDGKLAGSLTVPPTLQIFSVWADKMLVKVNNDEGEEVLQVVPIQKTGSPTTK